MCVCIYHVQITEYSLNSHLSFKHICMYMFWMHVLSCFSHIWVSVSLWTVAHQAPLFRGILQASILEWAVVPSSRGSSRPRIDPCFLCLLHWQAGFHHSCHLRVWIIKIIGLEKNQTLILVDMKKEIVVKVGQKNCIEDKIINFYITFIYMDKTNLHCLYNCEQ